ncbi:serine/threonine-protein kinase pim-1 isoform X1 [Larimichthys crocea]|uniref:serine/threonine-protein kinase pim-1 isoform X1 n=2 Tax=Larimichthys crocea TaxID=215358 RepID=UPI000F5E681D|nr:serine/threonine-protein kinase pim-1 isoform X1 [Larimichthys crocea]
MVTDRRFANLQTSTSKFDDQTMSKRKRQQTIHSFFKSKCQRRITSMPRESRASSMDDQTRRSKRKASPASEKDQRKRTRMSKSPPRNTSEKNVNQGVKRKASTDGKESSKTKKTEFEIFDFTQSDDEKASSSADSGRDSSGPLKEVQVNSKRKASNDGGNRNGKRKRSAEILETIQDRRDKFEAKYVQQNHLGEGGYGAVFAGYRKADNLPVAIKHVPNDNVFCTHVDNNGKEISAEVDIMLKLAEGRTGVRTSAPVSLLDWYDLGEELILVMERPVPSMDLSDYIQGNGGSLDEEEAKIIVKQLVDAAKELEDNCIFHRDIKVENILIETGLSTPRLRLIDFGLGCFFEESSCYHTFYGTPNHIPPEWFSRNTYHAGPTTVWQVGVVLYESLHRKPCFVTQNFLRNQQKISNELSEECQDFLKRCLAEVPEERPTLEELQLHEWLSWF